METKWIQTKNNRLEVLLSLGRAVETVVFGVADDGSLGGRVEDTLT
jgi:hypothetical protein